MVFSSISFLFFFLPILFLVYFLVPKKWKNGVLLIFSLIFYVFGEKWYIVLLLLSSVMNFIIGKRIEKSNNKKNLVLGLILNIGILFYFKYMNFFIKNFNDIFHLGISTFKIALPLGISFFTFQNIGYLVDVYKKDIKAENNIFTYLTYITFFPQLVAGPIVRYKDVVDDLKTREESLEKFTSGIMRFTYGLGKKVIIADTLYNVYKAVLGSNMSTLSYWLVALCFTFQIYYDFSGYSDMAIGLGRMFGFDFKENFNYPLIASSVTYFWRRWHMSLSSFFRDYVYIPLGGNRCSLVKTIRNISVVWLLTGFWHGASWNFILWGLYFLIFLILEKFVLKRYLKGGILSHIYTFLVVVFSFIIFNIDSMKEIGTFFKGMLGFGVELWNFESIYYLKNNIVILLISFLGMGPFLKTSIIKLKKGKLDKVIDVLEIIAFFTIFIISIALLLSRTFNPFIYFRF